MQNDRQQFKEQVAKSIGNMCNIWQTAAGISKDVTFGEQATTQASRWRTTMRSGGSQKVNSSKNKISKDVVFQLKKRSWADNLLNNNIYKKIKNTTTTTTIISSGADPLPPARGHPTAGRSSSVRPEFI